jgi:ATP-dependent DNA helicase RecG
MIPDLVKKQIRDGGGVFTELKSDGRDLASIAKTVCGFLNTLGGTIFCGVDESGKIIGLDSAEEALQEIQAYVQQNLTPKALFTVNIDGDGEKTIVSVEVPEGKDRPYVFDGSIYVREGGVTRKASAAKMREMVQTKSVTSERWERRPSMAMEENDLDRDELALTLREASESGRLLWLGEADDFTVLKSLAVYSAKGFTQAADVLFARDPSRRHPQTRVRVTRYSSDKAGSTFLDDQLISGPLVKVFNEAFSIISRNVSWESAFSADNVRRLDRSEYPLEAIREGLVNAFVHRDFSGFSGGVAVGIYPGRIEIWNSGHFPEGLKPSDLRKNHPSLPTNPDIAHVFYLRGLMERIGRGGQMIVNACREAGLPSPKWMDRPTGVTLSIFGKDNEASGEFIPNPRQMLLLNQLEVGGQILAIDYRERYAPEVTDRQARRDLAELEIAGYLQRVVRATKTTYRRIDRT